MLNGTYTNELAIGRYYARVLPQDKASLIRKLKSETSVTFLCDGVNDAPAHVEANLALTIEARTNFALNRLI